MGTCTIWRVVSLVCSGDFSCDDAQYVAERGQGMNDEGRKGKRDYERTGRTREPMRDGAQYNMQ